VTAVAAVATARPARGIGAVGAARAIAAAAAVAALATIATDRTERDEARLVDHDEVADLLLLAVRREQLAGERDRASGVVGDHLQADLPRALAGL
jgi:hypothetical protein